MSRPINLETSGWGQFDGSNPTDAMCERERQAFTQYTLKRLQKIPKTGSTQDAIWVGGVMAIVQMAYAVHAGAPPESAREALHDVLDFAWLQCASMASGKEDMN
ncbi:hypothetical protein [Sphingomonas sp. MMS24-J13]|uniref:hypothetical protein n=1 Tax=Sphingomonas sp. MMS24-J13 TaxID=3238686 RepID=UPI00384B379C